MNVNEHLIFSLLYNIVLLYYDNTNEGEINIQIREENSKVFIRISDSGNVITEGIIHNWEKGMNSNDNNNYINTNQTIINFISKNYGQNPILFKLGPVFGIVNLTIF